MSREYFLRDSLSERKLSAADLPLRVGGVDQGGLVIPGVSDDSLFAHIALHEGHAYIQPAADSNQLFHNDERLQDSAWLKSGDHIQVGGAVINWQVQGDKVFISVEGQSGDHLPRPPRSSQLKADKVDPHLSSPVHAGSVRKVDIPVHRTKTVTPPNKKNRGVLIGFILLLVIAGGFLLTASPVIIHTDPASATVNLKGFPPAVNLWNSRLALPGKYTVDISKPGYARLTESIDIAMSDMVNLQYTLDELPGRLSIKSEPKVRLKLSVEGNNVPLSEQGIAEIKSGKYNLSITTERYLTVKQELEIQGFGKSQQLNIVLQPAWANYSLTTEPMQADVYVDGKKQGTTPFSAELLQGNHKIKVRKEGFKQVELEPVIEAGKDVSVQKILLLPVDGTIKLDSKPAGANILIDGKFAGTTPNSINLSANAKHQLTLSKAGYGSTKHSFSLEPNEIKELKFSLKSEKGIVFLSIQPSDALVLLHGRNLKGKRRLKLASSLHSITVSKAGYISETISFTPNPGSSQNLSVKLKTKQQQQQLTQKNLQAAVLKSVAGHEMIRLQPEKTFNMGASRREAGRRANESQRLIKLFRPFYLSSKEVTNADFRRFKPTHDSGNMDGAALNGDDQPVVNVSWDDAARYMNWLSKQAGLPKAYLEVNKKMVAVNPLNNGYRLPTEAEWAWTARNQGQTKQQRYPWQGSFPPKNKVGNYADARIADTLADVVPAYDDGYRGSAPVASFAAWPKGFYDMGGNVSEWMHDYYAVYPGEASKLVTDPAGPDTGEHHVVKGASWRHGNLTELRLSYRDYSSKPRYDLGFRIARYE